jgi:hypothetical protein
VATTAAKFESDKHEAAEHPTLVPDLPDSQRHTWETHPLDPTQGRKIGSDPYDDPTQGRKIGADPYDDPTEGHRIGGDAYDDPTQGQKFGSAPYDDPTQGQKIGSDPDNDPTRGRLGTRGRTESITLPISKGCMRRSIVETSIVCSR